MKACWEVSIWSLLNNRHSAKSTEVRFIARVEVRSWAADNLRIWQTRQTLLQPLEKEERHGVCEKVARLGCVESSLPRTGRTGVPKIIKRQAKKFCYWYCTAWLLARSPNSRIIAMVRSLIYVNFQHHKYTSMVNNLVGWGCGAIMSDWSNQYTYDRWWSTRYTRGRKATQRKGDKRAN